MSLMRLLLPCRNTPMSSRMAALSLIGLLVSLLQVLGSLLTSLRNAGVVVGGVMSMVFVQVVKFRLVEVSVLFLGLSGLFRELRCGSVILALQSSSAVHLGVDNLGVVRHVGRLLDGHCGSAPFELVSDGDLLLLIQRMLHLRGLDTVRITKVRVLLIKVWCLTVGFRSSTGWVTTLLMRLLISVVGELQLCH